MTATKSVATTIVTRVRLRSTMCVPPCEAGVKPMPPMPESRPECIRMSEIRAIDSSTWMTAKTASTAREGYQRPATSTIASISSAAMRSFVT